VACLSSINLATFSVDAVYASDIKAWVTFYQPQ
jgi:hypothetical protein